MKTAGEIAYEVWNFSQRQPHFLRHRRIVDKRSRFVPRGKVGAVVDRRTGMRTISFVASIARSWKESRWISAGVEGWRISRRRLVAMSGLCLSRERKAHSG